MKAVLERVNKTHRLRGLFKPDNRGFKWNGQSGYTGSIFRRPIKGTPFYHYAFFYGFDSQGTAWLIENNWNGVECVTLEDFVYNAKWYDVVHWVTKKSAHVKIMQRARERAKYEYHERKNNCECFVNYCVNEKAESLQVNNMEDLANKVFSALEAWVAMSAHSEMAQDALDGLKNLRTNLAVPRDEKINEFLERRSNRS